MNIHLLYLLFLVNNLALHLQAMSVSMSPFTFFQQSTQKDSLFANDFNSNLTSPSLLSELLRPFSQHRRGLYANLSPIQRLATTPLYCLTSSNGQPYLQDDMQSGNQDQRAIIYFMSSDDANDFLDDMVQSNPSQNNEFRVMATSMEKVMSKVMAKKQSRKFGRFPIQTLIRIQPSARQCANAEKAVVANGASNWFVGSKLRANKKKANSRDIHTDLAIPMFSINGLLIRRRNQEVVKPYYFAMEDLVEDWRILQGNQTRNRIPAVEVSDFADVMCSNLVQTNIDGTVESISDRSLEYPRIFQKWPFKHIRNAAVAPMKSLSQTLSNLPLLGRHFHQKDEKITFVPGIVPPKREIDMLWRYYRNKEGLRNEYSKAYILGMPRERQD